MKTSRKKQSTQKTYLISKYGLNNVQTLIDFLQDEFDCNGELSKAHKLKEQIQYLEREKKNYISKEKNHIIEKIMTCVDQEGENILKEFESSSKSDFLQLLTDIEDIQFQLKNQHEKEYKLLQNELIIDLKMFLQKKSSVITELHQQLHLLCSSQLYQQAQIVKKRLEKEMGKNGEKKYYEWKQYKQKILYNLAQKQQKQRKSQKHRFEIMLIEEQKRKNEEYDILKKKINVQRKKMLENLIKKQSKYQSQLSSLTNSRIKITDWDKKEYKIKRCQNFQREEKECETK